MTDTSGPKPPAAARAADSPPPGPSAPDGTVEFLEAGGADSDSTDHSADGTAETCIVAASSSDTDGPQPGSREPAATIDPAQGKSDPLGATGVWEESSTDDAGFSVADALSRGLAPTVDPDASSKGAGSPATKSLPTVAGYEVLGELGRGGMGVVYKARQIGLNRLVALKMVLAGAHAGEQQLARFHIEAQAVAALQHPNIVQIYEVGNRDGFPFFSLEFVDGGPLDKRLAGKPQPAREAARLLEMLARAMYFAHQHGIVHRDLKPANVLMTAGGVAKITDFGLAKRLEDDGESSQTRTGTIMGTPSYMAPEQARGDIREIGPAADQYALGALLYELLTGRPPFMSPKHMDTIMQVLRNEPVPPTRLQPRVPKDLETICLRALQKEVHKRYPDCLALAEDVRRFSAGEPIQARPVSKLERGWRWCKRNPRVAVLSSAVLVLVLTAASAMAVSAGQMARERKNLAEVQKVADERLEEATTAIRDGHDRQAKVLLNWFDPLVESNPALAETRGKLRKLGDQVNLYSEFKRRLDTARYFALFGSATDPNEARAASEALIELYDQIERGSGMAECGMPPLSPAQRQLLQEDYFEALLVPAQVEWDRVASADGAARKEVAQKAVAWLDRAEKIYPEAWFLYQRRGFFLNELGDSGRAAADLRRASTMRPTSPLDRFWYSFSLHTEGAAVKKQDSTKADQNFRRAIQEYAALLRLRPDHFWAYFDAAVCHFELGSANEAVMCSTMCIQLRPDVVWPYYNRGTILLAQRQFQAAVEDLSVALERNPQKNADWFCRRGEAYQGLRKFDLAIADYGRALAIDDQHFAAHSGLGVCYFSLSDYAQARNNSGRAIAIAQKPGAAPPSPLLAARNHNVHGAASLHLHDFDACLTDWQELAKLQPKSQEPHYNMAITYKAQRRYDEALQALAEAIKRKPDDSKLYLFRAQLNHEQGKLNEALSDHAFVLHELKVEEAGILNDHADLLRTMGRLTEALATYERSIKLLPKQVDAYLGACVVQLLDGQPEFAGPILAQMMDANPDSPEAFLRHAEQCRNQQQWQNALSDCDQAAKLDPKSSLPALVRASLQAARGEHREAVQAARQTLESARPDGNLLHAAACVWSLASHAAQESGNAELAGQYADQAASYLEDTMTKGFLDLNYQTYNRMLVDPALAPILQHPKVLELLPVLRQLVE